LEGRVRIRLVGSALLATFLVCKGATASEVPKAVQEELDHLRTSCRENGSDISDALRALRWEDLDGDGRPDAIIEAEKARCSEGYSPYCGTAGCMLVILKALPNGGHRTLFSDQVWSFEILGEGKRRRMRFQLHGGFCGRAGAEGCTKEVRITGRPFALRQR